MAKLYIPHQGKLIEYEVDPNEGIDNMRSLGHMLFVGLITATLRAIDRARTSNLTAPELVLGHPVHETEKLLQTSLLILYKGDLNRAIDAVVSKVVYLHQYEEMYFELGYYSLNDIITPAVKFLG